MASRHPAGHPGSPAARASNCAQLVANLEKIADKLIDSKALVLRNIIGSGQFGEVRKGDLVLAIGGIQTVAVKKLVLESADMATQAIDEALRMKSLHHPNVLGLIGVAIGENFTPMIVTPFMERGTLLDYLQDERHIMPFEEMLKYGLQVAMGMAYLARQKLVHRDLSARNCMMNAQGAVKVADFGMTREIISKDYYRIKSEALVPICWMALESLEEDIFTVKSDVWSYGVVLWEITSRGKEPYGIKTTVAIYAELLKGHRLPLPKRCSYELYSIILGCWDRSPDRRPGFDQLVELVGSVNPKPQEL